MDKGICNKAFIWNPSNCKCEYDKSCDIRQYLDHKKCKCRKEQLLNQLKNKLKILMKVK